MAIIFLRPRMLVCSPKYSGMISAISSSVRPMRLSQSILAMRVERVVVVLAMAAALAARDEQAEAFVVADRAGRHARPACELADAHAPRINRHANVKVRMSPPAALALRRPDQALRQRLPRPRRPRPRGARRRLLRPAGPQRRGQDDAHQRGLQPHPRHRRRRAHLRPRPRHPRRARRSIGLAEQDVNLDRFLDVEETLLYHGGYYGMDRARARRRAGEMMDVFDLRAKAHVRAPMLSRRHAPAPAAGARAHARAAAGHPRRADRRRRLRAAPGAVGLHPPPARRGHDDPAHHALPRGGRGAVRGDRAHPRRAAARARQRRRAAQLLRGRLAGRRLRQGDGS